ncbi:hypothetical protein [Streptomyces hesseae]|uniref:Uncharacterized protein n=1 Tax=Streptomyces hesseae TaxID=3075519 RepID=A0ABU2STK6_9ACTN|nr:hypothetical protein [Streptomyces sp. DSM 40473]MDT0451951.1 hypothetical protein [Streptomyces sp. DSM 40473]
MSLKCRLLIAACLLATTIEFTWLGSEDVNGALTYAGRLTGVTFLAAALLELFASGTLLAGRPSTPGKISGYPAAAVALGVFASFFANLALLVLQIENLSLSMGLLVWPSLTAWSLIALVIIHREHEAGNFSIPNLQVFKAGAIAAALIALVNFGYTQIYQPYATPAQISTTVEIGMAHIDHGTVSVPIHLASKNTGSVGVYILGSLYQVTAGKAVYSDAARTGRDWLQDINNGQIDLLKYQNEGNRGYQLLAQGRFMRQGRKLDPGAEVASDKIIQFPVGNHYDVLNATGDVVYLRTDRAVLTSEEYETSGRSSWHKDKSHSPEMEAPGWVAHKGVETFKYQSPIVHSNAELQHTRSPRNVTLWWVLEDPQKSWNGPYLVATIASAGEENKRPDPARPQQLSDEYGLDHSSSGRAQKSIEQITGSTKTN